MGPYLGQQTPLPLQPRPDQAGLGASPPPRFPLLKGLPLRPYHVGQGWPHPPATSHGRGVTLTTSDPSLPLPVWLDPSSSLLLC